MTEKSRAQAVSKQVKKLWLIPLGMFAFGFALVPLYDVFCDVTGLNGKTGRVEASAVEHGRIDRSRTVTVTFIANEGNGLPWNFAPVDKQMTVHPGGIYSTSYRVSNRSHQQTTGQAVPSVSPTRASLYFDKTECFCFTQQILQPDETRDMPVQFVIKADLPEEIHEMTLSYTFFNVEKPS